MKVCIVQLVDKSNKLFYLQEKHEHYFKTFQLAASLD